MGWSSTRSLLKNSSVYNLQQLPTIDNHKSESYWGDERAVNVKEVEIAVVVVIVGAAAVMGEE